MKTKRYIPKFYRNWPKTDDLKGFDVRIEDSDLHIQALTDLSQEAKGFLYKYRMLVEEYIKENPRFLETLKPYKVEMFNHNIIKDMSKASVICRVGPMAAVAGAIAEYVAKELMYYSSEIIVENGGDLFIHSKKKRVVNIYSGVNTPSLNIEIDPRQTPCGICTSSGIFGKSTNFGKADSVTIFAKSAPLADALATACGNRIKSKKDMNKILSWALHIHGVFGVVITIDRTLGVKGNLRIC